MKVGTFVNGSFSPLPVSVYTALGAVAVHNQVYEIRMDTPYMSVEDEMQALKNLSTMVVPGMRVLGVETTSNSARMQVQANQFSWAMFIGALPALILFTGLIIGVIFISRLTEASTVIVILGAVAISAYFVLGEGKKK